MVKGVINNLLTVSVLLVLPVLCVLAWREKQVPEHPEVVVSGTVRAIGSNTQRTPVTKIQLVTDYIHLLSGEGEYYPVAYSEGVKNVIRELEIGAEVQVGMVRSPTMFRRPVHSIAEIHLEGEKLYGYESYCEEVSYFSIVRDVLLPSSAVISLILLFFAIYGMLAGGEQGGPDTALDMPHRQPPHN